MPSSHRRPQRERNISSVPSNHASGIIGSRRLCPWALVGSTERSIHWRPLERGTSGARIDPRGLLSPEGFAIGRFKAILSESIVSDSPIMATESLGRYLREMPSTRGLLEVLVGPNN